MFCINCGCKLEQDAVFCNQCGTKVEPMKQEEVTPQEEVQQKELLQQEEQIKEAIIVQDEDKTTDKTKKENKSKKKGKKKKVAVTLVTLVTILIVLLGGTVGFLLYYLNNSKVEYTFNEITAEQFLNEQGKSVYTYKSEGKFELELNSDVVNTMVKTKLSNVTSEQIKFKDVYVNLEDEIIYLDVSYKGVNLPLRSEIEIDTKNNNIIIEAKEYKIGEKLFGTPDIISKHLPEEFAQIDFKLDNLSEFFNISETNLSGNNLQVELSMDLVYIQDIINTYIEQYDPEMIDSYHLLSDTTYGTDLAYDIIYFYEFIETYQVEEYIKDFMEEGVLTKEFLSFLKDDAINEIYNKYGSILGDKIAKEDIFAIKEEILVEQKISYARDLLDYLDQYEYDFYDDILVYNGLLYDRVEKEYITPEYISEWYSLYYNEAASMDYIVNEYGERFIIYNSKSGNIYKIDSYDIEILDDKVNIDYSYPTPKTISSSDINDITEKIMNYYFSEEEKVYYRYLKIVDDSAYAIISTSGSPTEVYGFSLMNTGDTWEVIDVDGRFTTINVVYPEFNVFTLPEYEPHEISLYELTPQSFDVLLESLVTNGYYESVSELYVEFYSYDNDHVYVLLNDGNEFIYSIFFNEISEVHDRETAEQLWTIQPGLTLQKLQ